MTALAAYEAGLRIGGGRWAHVLLADGNVGIGGDVVALLRRCAELVRPGGTVVVEVERPGAGHVVQLLVLDSTCGRQVAVLGSARP